MFAIVARGLEVLVSVSHLTLSHFPPHSRSSPQALVPWALWDGVGSGKLQLLINGRLDPLCKAGRITTRAHPCERGLFLVGDYTLAGEPLS